MPGAPHLQAFPARETWIGKFSAIPIGLPGGETVNVAQAADDLKTILTGVLVDFEPTRFLFFDPPKEGSIVVEGLIKDFHWTHHLGHTANLELDITLEVNTVDGVLLDTKDGKARAEKVDLRQVEPHAFVWGIEPALESCFNAMAQQIASSARVNTASWHSQVTAVDTEVDGVIVHIPVSTGEGIEVGNVLDVEQQVPADPGPVYQRTATIQVVDTFSGESRCRYYPAPGPVPARAGDRVAIHYFDTVSADSATRTQLYGVDGNGLIRIDKTTGAGERVGAGSGEREGGVRRGAAAAANGRILTAEGRSLWELDPVSGTATLVISIGDLPVGYVFLSLAFDPVDQLYALLFPATGLAEVELLARIDATTGACAVVGDLGRHDIRSLAFDAGGALYGLCLTQGIVTVDPRTGTVTSLGGAGEFGQDDEALVFDQDGTLYCARFNLRCVDLATCKTQIIGPIGRFDVRDLVIGRAPQP